MREHAAELLGYNKEAKKAISGILLQAVGMDSISIEKIFDIHNSKVQKLQQKRRLTQSSSSILEMFPPNHYLKTKESHTLYSMVGTTGL